MAGIIHGIAMGNPPFPEKNSLIFFKGNMASTVPAGLPTCGVAAVGKSPGTLCSPGTSQRAPLCAGQGT